MLKKEPSPNLASRSSSNGSAAPRAIFANYYDDGIDCERCKQTVTPISQALDIPINFTYGFPAKLGGNAKAAQAIFNEVGWD